MRFHEFLRATVLICAASASVLAAITVIRVADGGRTTVAIVALAWWLICAITGLWLGHQGETSSPIASLLAAARTRRTLPEVNPARTLLNRLWPLAVLTVGAAAAGIALPQVPAVAAGFEIICALAWRDQAAAVRAIEGRDGVRFYVEHTPLLKTIALVRTPGFRTTPSEQLPGAATAPSAGPPPL